MALATLSVSSFLFASCEDAPVRGDHPSVSADDAPTPAETAPSPAATAPSPRAGVPACTRIVGYSQTRQWYRASFETVAPDDNFELFWMGGAGIRSWAGPAAWDSGTLESRCTTGAPTRIVIDVGVGAENLGDIETYKSFIRAAVEMARTRFPGVEVGLQPMVGGPGYRVCQITIREVTYDVNATLAAPYVAQAIDEMIGEDPTIFRGPNPQVAECDMFRDALGHLTLTTRDDSVPGEVHAGQVIGEFFAGE